MSALPTFDEGLRRTEVRLRGSALFILAFQALGTSPYICATSTDLLMTHRHHILRYWNVPALRSQRYLAFKWSRTFRGRRHWRH